MDTAVRIRHVAVLLTASICVVGLAATGGPRRAVATPGPDTVRSCATPTAHRLACPALRRTGTMPDGVRPDLPSGFGPTDFRSLYSLPANGGSGQTIAIIDAYDDPNAAVDLAVYRSTFGLPALTSGQLRKVNNDGQASPLPPADAGWAEEISLDLDIVSAIAPKANILLVEAASASPADLFGGVNSAVKIGAKYVTMSFGGAEDSSDPTYDAAYLNHPGVAMTAPIADGSSQNYPATSRYVTAVGGTTVQSAGAAGTWAESAWGGGGCSLYSPRPTWQQGLKTGCANRAVADVAAVADPNTGAAVYDTYGGDIGWEVFGGTTVASSIIIGVYALAGPPAPGTNPVSYPYADPADLHDITTGPGAAVGWDPPTGLGTPNGVDAFAPPGVVTVGP